MITISTSEHDYTITLKFIMKQLHKLIVDLYLYHLFRLTVSHNNELTSTKFTVHGRRIPLKDIRENIFRKHRKLGWYLLLNLGETSNYYNSSSLSHTIISENNSGNKFLLPNH